MNLLTRIISAVILSAAGMLTTTAIGLVMFALYVIAGTALAAGWAVLSIYCTWELARACLQVD